MACAVIADARRPRRSCWSTARRSPTSGAADPRTCSASRPASSAADGASSPAIVDVATLQTLARRDRPRRDAPRLRPGRRRRVPPRPGGRVRGRRRAQSPPATGWGSPPRPTAATGSTTSSRSSSARSGTRSTPPDAGTLEGVDARPPDAASSRVHPTTVPTRERPDLSAPGAMAAVYRELAADDARNEQILDRRRRGTRPRAPLPRPRPADRPRRPPRRATRRARARPGGPERRAWAPAPATAAIERLDPIRRTRRCSSSRPATSSARASTARRSTPCSWPPRSPSRAVSSSTPAASCALPRQAHRRGARLPRHRATRSRRVAGQTRTRLHQPRLPRPPQRVKRGNILATPGAKSADIGHC